MIKARRCASPVGDGENLDIRPLRSQMRDQPARRTHSLVGVGSDHNEITAEVVGNGATRHSSSAHDRSRLLTAVAAFQTSQLPACTALFTSSSSKGALGLAVVVPNPRAQSGPVRGP